MKRERIVRIADKAHQLVVISPFCDYNMAVVKRQYALLFILYTLFNASVNGQVLPRIEPLPQLVNFSREQGELSKTQLIEVALIASGSTGINEDFQTINRFVKDLSDRVVHIKNAYDRGEEILQLLHDTLFVDYIEDQTKVDVLMALGTYNCVSSAVIYMIVGRAAGLNIQGVRTVDHAFASLIINQNMIDIETTNEWGFDPGTQKEFTDSFSGNTGFNYVPPGNYSLRANITDKQMVGLILQNRMALLQRMNKHGASVPLAVDRYALTQSDEALKDMYDSFSNYSSRLNAKGQYEKGINFLKKTISRWGSSQIVTKAIEALIHNYLLSLIEKSQTEEALSYLLDPENQNIITPASLEANKIMVYERMTVDWLNSDRSFAQVQSHLDRIWKEEHFPKKKWISYTLHNYVKESQIIARKKNWFAAYQFVLEAPVDIHHQRKYIQLLDSCKRNYVISAHNQFADLYNSGLYFKAKEIITEALSLLPKDKTLTSDLKRLKDKSF